MFCEDPRSVFVTVTAPVALLTDIPVPAIIDVTDAVPPAIQSKSKSDVTSPVPPFVTVVAISKAKDTDPDVPLVTVNCEVVDATLVISPTGVQVVPSCM